jgi:hypothetical protein
VSVAGCDVHPSPSRVTAGKSSRGGGERTDERDDHDPLADEQAAAAAKEAAKIGGRDPEPEGEDS